jgi:hypothetical protein
MADIVLVHGIDQQQRSADSLEQVWIPDLAGGIRAAGFPQLADKVVAAKSHASSLDIRMAFYGHLFLRANQQGSQLVELTPDAQVFAERLASEWLARGAVRARKTKDREEAARQLAYVQDEIGLDQQGVLGHVRSTVNSLARISWFAPLGFAFAERFINQALAQVSAYFTDETIREAAQEAVDRLIGPETTVVIGHSLGTVVAYEVIYARYGQANGNTSLPLFLTLGSPLGLRTVIYERLIPQPPCFPGGVVRWANIVSPDDLVAAEPALDGMFPGQGAAGDRWMNCTVDNGSEPHNASFYLTKPETGKTIADALMLACPTRRFSS